MELDEFANVSAVLRCGVYALVLKGQVVYVGKSKNMLTRVYTHRNLWSTRRSKHKLNFIPTKGILYDEVHVRPCSLEDIDDLEQAMIAKYKPRYNVKHNNGNHERKLGPVTINVGGMQLKIGGTPPPSDFVRRI